MKRFRTRRSLVAILGVTLAAMPNGACGTGGSGNGETPVGDVPSTLPPESLTLLVHGEFNLSSSQGGTPNLVVPFSIATRGDLRARASWSRPSDAMRVGFYAAGCTGEQLGVGSCASLVSSQAEAAASGSTVYFPSVEPGQFVLGIQNRGSDTQSGAYQVVLDSR